MLEKLKGISLRFEEIERALSEPDVFSDMEKYRALSEEQKELRPIIETYQKYGKELERMQEAKDLMSDPEMSDLAQEEYTSAQQNSEKLLKELRLLLLPKDPNDGRNVILEIRSGAGGEEAALFAQDIFRMYTLFSEKRGWKTEVVQSSVTELGGIKELSMIITGAGAYSRLKYESGVHRVQRVPETETQGRIHTSTITVAVLPEMDEVEFHLDPKDLQIDTFRSSGAGGQKVNKTSSAIRVTHIPTGTVVECQDERSQYKNKDRALKVLASRLYDAERKKQENSVAAERKNQVGTGDRSERIRTYNFPQGRVTDHRIGLTLYKLDAILNGEIDEITEALLNAEQVRRLQGEDENV